MNLLSRVMSYLYNSSQRTTGLQPVQPSYYQEASSTVTPDTAMQVSAVWACVRLLAESVGSLPLNVYKINADGSEEIAFQHPLHRLLQGKVNRHQTRQEYVETLMWQMALHGNDYSLIEKNGAGEIFSLWPLMSAQMEVRLLDTGAIEYQYTEGGKRWKMPDTSVWHNKMFGNGVIGLSPLAYARNSIALAQSAEQTTTSIYANGSKPSGTLEVDKFLTEEQRASVRSNFSGLTDGDQRLLLLEGGTKFKAISLTPEDIELLASRRFQIEDIARVFGVPSVLINDTSSTTAWGTGVQQIVQGFYRLGLRPYLSRIESSINSRLLRPEERGRYVARFDFSALIRPDFAERLKVYKEAVTGGIMAPNEARRQEGLVPKEGGDSLFLQQQMYPVDQLAKPGRMDAPNPRG